MGFQERTISIHDTKVGTRSVDALTLEHWGIHAMTHDGETKPFAYVVDHLATGRSALTFRRKADALAFAKALQIITSEHGDVTGGSARTAKGANRLVADAIVAEYQRLSDGRTIFQDRLVWY